MKSVKSKNGNLNDSREMRASTLKPDEEDWLDKSTREALSEAARQARINELSKGEDGGASRPVR